MKFSQDLYASFDNMDYTEVDFDRCYQSPRLHDFAHTAFGRQLCEPTAPHFVQLVRTLATVIGEEWTVLWTAVQTLDARTRRMADIGVHKVGRETNAANCLVDALKHQPDFEKWQCERRNVLLHWLVDKCARQDLRSASDTQPTIYQDFHSDVYAYLFM
jgi:hypothetical protein